MATPAQARQPIRVVIADDHPILRQALREILKEQPDLELVAEAANGNDILSLVRETHPDILLLDVAMPGRNGMEVMRQLQGSPTNVIFFTAGIERQEVMEALTLGLRGLVEKGVPTTVLLKSIRCVAAGEYWIDRKTLTEWAARDANTPLSVLTPREREVMAEVVSGATNRTIADKFGISEDTVKRHLTNIYDKLGVSTRLELALFAVNHKLVASLSLLMEK